MKKKKKDDLEQYKDMVVADMNVEGMPWFVKKQAHSPDTRSESQQGPPLTVKETRRIMGGAMAAAMLVGFAIIGLFFLFLLFCVYVWLR